MALSFILFITSQCCGGLSVPGTVAGARQTTPTYSGCGHNLSGAESQE